MKAVRPTVQNSRGSAVRAALVVLVRLLARQAARDWAKVGASTEPSQGASIAEKPRK